MFNDSVKLKWQGKEYDCPITMNLVKTMERNGVNILNISVQLSKGGVPPVSLIAELYSYVLQAGGCDVAEEQIYQSIMSDVGNEDNLALLKAAQYVTSMFFPEIEGAERNGKGTVKK